MYLIEEGSKLSFDSAILLWHTWGGLIPSPYCLQAILKAMFSPALLHCRYCTCIFYLVFKFLIKPIITIFESDYSFKNKSMCSPYCPLLQIAIFYSKSWSWRWPYIKRVLSPGIFKQSTVFLFTLLFLLVPKHNLYKVLMHQQLLYPWTHWCH